jgi:hypothetical protein
MRRQSSIERPVSGHGSKGSRTIGLACLLRRIGHLVNPADARTWSPCGTTPIMRHRMVWKWASMAAALGYQADGNRAWLCLLLGGRRHDTDNLLGGWTSSRPPMPASGWSCCETYRRRIGVTRCAPTLTPSAH